MKRRTEGGLIEGRSERVAVFFADDTHAFEKSPIHLTTNDGDGTPGSEPECLMRYGTYCLGCRPYRRKSWGKKEGNLGLLS